MAQLTYEQVAELLQYDPETGKLYWKERGRHLFPSKRYHTIWNVRFSGKEAFLTNSVFGHMLGKILRRTQKAHRVAWLLYYGEWPSSHLDHINGDPADNRICNLRLASRSLNMRNRKIFKNNKTGVNGVSALPSGRWVARIKVDGKTRSIGVFDTLVDAAEARRLANIEYGYSERHGCK